MKMDQVATYCHNKTQELAIIEAYGLTDQSWAKDHVTGWARVRRADGTYWEGESVANLSFNYKFGTEYEILTYRAGRHWHIDEPHFKLRTPFVSHIGYHLDDGEDFPTFPEACPMVQELKTISHTNSYVNERRRKYHYQIFDTRSLTGFYSKYIRRINPDV